MELAQAYRQIEERLDRIDFPALFRGFSRFPRPERGIVPRAGEIEKRKAELEEELLALYELTM